MNGKLRSLDGISLTDLSTARKLSGCFDAVISFRDPECPLELSASQHLVLEISDICEPMGERALARSADIERMLTFARQFPERLLVHCRHGISRSSAAAFAILSDRYGQGTEARALEGVLALQPIAIPNRHIVALADALLGRQGQLIGALDAWRELQPWAHETDAASSLPLIQEEKSMAETRSPPFIVQGSNIITARVGRLIPAPIEAVFLYLADATNDPDWIKVLSISKRLDAGGLGVGSQFEQTAVSPTGKATVKWQIREFDPMRRIYCESMAGQYRFIGGYDFEARGQSTWVEKFASFERRGLLLAVPRTIGNRLMRNYFETWLKALGNRRW